MSEIRHSEKYEQWVRFFPRAFCDASDDALKWMEKLLEFMILAFAEKVRKIVLFGTAIT